MLSTKGSAFKIFLDFLKLSYLFVVIDDSLSFITEICQPFFENLNHLYLKTTDFMENPEAAVQRCS